MPAKGKSKVTAQQRRRIAAGKSAGKTHRAIAREAGLAVTTVDHQARHPEVVTLTMRLKKEHEPQLVRMYKLSLETMERDIGSKNRGVCAAARAQLLRLLPLGDPPLLRIAPQDPGRGDFTLEELLICYRTASLPG